MKILELFFFTIVTTLVYHLCYCAIRKYPFSLSCYAQYLLYNLGLLILSIFIMPRTFDGLYMFVTISYTFGAAFFIFHQQGRQLISSGCLLVAIGLAVDMGAGFLTGVFFGWDVLADNYDLSHRSMLIITCMTMVFGLLLAGGLILFRRLMVLIKNHPLPSLLYLFRPALLFGTTLVISLAHIERVREYQGITLLEKAGYAYLPIVLTAIVSSSYIYQDIKQITLLRQNKALTQQIALNDTLLSETRTFRHNIANLLYGFEGALLSNNLSEIREYYQHIATQYAAENHANASSLKQIPYSSVVSLLLRKIERARMLEIPFYLYVDPQTQWKRTSMKPLCLILGTLLDNAIEAAYACTSPFVCVSFSKTDNCLEIVIKNTFDFLKQQPPSGSILPTSNKPNHSGIGLTSLHKELNRNPNLLFNQFSSGRYVISVVTIL